MDPSRVGEAHRGWPVWRGRLGTKFIRPVFNCCFNRDPCCYRTSVESLLFQGLTKVMSAQGRGRGKNNGMSGAFFTELGLEMILRGR